MPPSPPSPKTPPRPIYGKDRRLDLERELYRALHGNDGAPYCWNVDESFLMCVVESIRSWPNRDRTLWLCDQTLPAEDQQPLGIRVDIRIRSHVRNTAITGDRWMKQRNWVKSAFFKPRSGDASWDRLHKDDLVTENVELRPSLGRISLCFHIATRE